MIKQLMHLDLFFVLYPTTNTLWSIYANFEILNEVIVVTLHFRNRFQIPRINHVNIWESSTTLIHVSCKNLTYVQNNTMLQLVYEDVFRYILLITVLPK